MKKKDLRIGKYFPIDAVPNLRMGVAMVFERGFDPKPIPDSIIKPDELFKHENPDGKKKFYLPQITGAHNFYTPLTNASYVEIAFRIESRGPRLTFGRKGEDKPFTIGEKGKGRGHIYVALRLYHPNNLPDPNWHFEPIFIRVSNDRHMFFLKVYAYWNSTEIKIDILSDPKDLPRFF